MMDYQNRADTSCVYDAFERAGLPTNKKMLYGVTFGEVVDLLEKYGYTIYRKGATVSLPNDKGFFVIRTPMQSSRLGHAEYHITAEGVTDYPPESICAIAIKQ